MQYEHFATAFYLVASLSSQPKIVGLIWFGFAGLAFMMAVSFFREYQRPSAADSLEVTGFKAAIWSCAIGVVLALIAWWMMSYKGD